VRIDAITIDLCIRFISGDWLLTIIAASDSRVIVWLGELLLGRWQRVRVGGQLSY